VTDRNLLNISISIVTYNCQDTIQDTLSTLFGVLSTNDKHNVFVIDNGSDDNTLMEIAPFLDRLTFIQSPQGNIGFGAAHNLIINRLESDIHLIINPDIKMIDSDAITILCNCFSNHSDVGMTVPRILDEKGDLQYLCRRNPTVLDLALRFLPGHLFKKREDYHMMKDMDYGKPFDVPFASGCFMAIRTSLFRDLGGFDDRFFLYAEDADLTRRVNQVSRTVYVPEAVVCHVWERASYKDINMTKIHLKSLWTYFRKWGFQFK